MHFDSTRKRRTEEEQDPRGESGGESEEIDSKPSLQRPVLGLCDYISLVNGWCGLAPQCPSDSDDYHQHQHPNPPLLMLTCLHRNHAHQEQASSWLVFINCEKQSCPILLNAVDPLSLSDAADLERIGDLGEDGLERLVLLREAVGRVRDQSLPWHERENGLLCVPSTCVCEEVKEKESSQSRIHRRTAPMGG